MFPEVWGEFSILRVPQTSRKVLITSILTARRAGKSPPKSPIARVITTATVRIIGPNRKAIVLGEGVEVADPNRKDDIGIVAS
ncbi:MAG: hypothetical protein JO252_19215, partial [Planctomycetaceae bacterium]|nr:hypothetical protein [Planctomycetaceae bacterium]